MTFETLKTPDRIVGALRMNQFVRIDGLPFRNFGPLPYEIRENRKLIRAGKSELGLFEQCEDRFVIVTLEGEIWRREKVTEGIPRELLEAAAPNGEGPIRWCVYHLALNAEHIEKRRADPYDTIDGRFPPLPYSIRNGENGENGH